MAESRDRFDTLKRRLAVAPHDAILHGPDDCRLVGPQKRDLRRMHLMCRLCVNDGTADLLDQQVAADERLQSRVLTHVQHGIHREEVGETLPVLSIQEAAVSCLDGADLLERKQLFSCYHESI